MTTYTFTKRDAQRLDVVEAYNRAKESKVSFLHNLITIKQAISIEDIKYPFRHVPTGMRFATLDSALKFWARRLKPAAVKKAVNPFTGK